MIIGISGKMRTGKNVIADHLCEKYGFVQVGFADKLKQICMDLFGLTKDECYDHKTARSRDILQKVGVAMRDIEYHVWCQYVLRNVKEGQPTVISDVRFKNEAAMVKEYGGKIIRINRHTGDQFGSNHISETDLDTYDQFDAVIDNNGSLEELYHKIDQIMESWLGRSV